MALAVCARFLNFIWLRYTNIVLDSQSSSPQLAGWGYHFACWPMYIILISLSPCVCPVVRKINKPHGDWPLPWPWPNWPKQAGFTSFHCYCIPSHTRTHSHTHAYIYVFYTHTHTHTQFGSCLPLHIREHTSGRQCGCWSFLFLRVLTTYSYLLRLLLRQFLPAPTTTTTISPAYFFRPFELKVDDLDTPARGQWPMIGESLTSYCGHLSGQHINR